MPIHTPRTFFPLGRRKGTVYFYTAMAADMRNKYIQGLWAGGETPMTIQPGFAPPPRVVAYINHGKWVADCPDCRGAEVVDPDEPVFFCLACFNREAENRFRRVIFPPGKFRQELEDILLQRPAPENRNWYPSESVAELIAENVMYLGEHVAPKHAVGRS